MFMKLIRDFQELYGKEIVAFNNVTISENHSNTKTCGAACIVTKDHGILFFNIRIYDSYNADTQSYLLSSGYERYCLLKDRSVQAFLLSVGFTKEEIGNYLSLSKQLNSESAKRLHAIQLDSFDLRREADEIKEHWKDPDNSGQ